jgi:hypothetical protein
MVRTILTERARLGEAKRTGSTEVSTQYNPVRFGAAVVARPVKVETQAAHRRQGPSRCATDDLLVSEVCLHEAESNLSMSGKKASRSNGFFKLVIWRLVSSLRGKEKFALIMMVGTSVRPSCDWR